MPQRTRHVLAALLAAALLAAALPGAASALDTVPGQVVVKFDPGSTAQTAQVADGHPTVLKVRDVRSALRGLRSRSDVAYAVPNVRAHAADVAATPGFIPDDEGRGGVGGWQSVQWDFDGPFGVNAPQACSPRYCLETATISAFVGGKNAHSATPDRKCRNLRQKRRFGRPPG